MPRCSSFPTLFDECKTLSLSSLKKWGYLKLGEWKGGNIAWSRAGNQTGAISFSLNMFSEKPSIELSYRISETSFKYIIQLVSVRSNIGKGVLWYFLCPRTGKRCRKLYKVGNYFLHRTAFKGCFYEKQTYSHRTRSLSKSFETFFGADKAYETLHSKYFKTFYAGKPTKHFLKMNKIIRNSEQISAREIDALIYR